VAAEKVGTFERRHNMKYRARRSTDDILWSRSWFGTFSPAT